MNLKTFSFSKGLVAESSEVYAHRAVFSFLILDMQLDEGKCSMKRSFVVS